MRGWGCCTASLLKVWYFAILMMFWKFNLDMCILSYCTHYYQKSPENGHAWPVIEGPKLKCYTLPPPLNEGLALINSVFCPTSSTYQRSETLETWSVSRNRLQEIISKFGYVAWPILQTVLYFTDRHFTDWSVK